MAAVGLVAHAAGNESDSPINATLILNYNTYHGSVDFVVEEYVSHFTHVVVCMNLNVNLQKAKSDSP